MKYTFRSNDHETKGLSLADGREHMRRAMADPAWDGVLNGLQEGQSMVTTVGGRNLALLVEEGGGPEQTGSQPTR